MPLSPEQLAFRKTRLSSTDISAILGLNPWRTAADVQFEKLYQTESLKENESMAIGTMLEPSIVRWAADELGGELRYPLPTTVHPKCDLLCATPDAAVVLHGQVRGVEAKTAGIVRGFAAKEEWGEAGSAEVPEMYVAQVQTQIAVMGWEVVTLAALIAGRGRVLYEIPREMDAEESLIAIASAWWKKHIIEQAPCVDADGNPIYPSMETLKRIVRKSQSPRNVSASLVKSWLEWRQTRLDAEKCEKAAQEALLAGIGDGDAAVVGDVEVATYKEISRKGYTVAATTYRTLRPHKNAGEVLAAYETTKRLTTEELAA